MPIVDPLATLVAAGPVEPSGGKRVLYEVTAYAHSATGLSGDDWPSVGVTLSCTTRVRRSSVAIPPATTGTMKGS